MSDAFAPHPSSTPRRRRPRLLPALLVLASLGGCGSTVYRHQIEVTIDDPSHRLGPPPSEVSIFDSHMGRSEEWARKTMGPASATEPFQVPYSHVGTATAFDPPRPDKVELSIALPRLERRGFFVLNLNPGSATSARLAAAFQPWGDSFPAAEAPSLQASYTATPDAKGWRLRIRLEVPPAPAGSTSGR